MINKLMDSIFNKLLQVFGDDTNIHTETNKQDFIEPCFFIKVLNPTQKQIIGERYFKQNPFDIHYFVGDTLDKNKTINQISEQLFDNLDYITLADGDLIHGTKMRCEVVDEVLHFFVNYNLFVNKMDIPEESMSELIVNNQVKEVK